MRLLISVACLFLVWNSPAFSNEPVATEKTLLRLVCQQYSNGKFDNRVIILDQLSTKTYPEDDYTSEITGEMMLEPHKTSQGGRGFVLGMVKGRLRGYDDVSPGLIKSIVDPVTEESIGVKVGKDFDRRLEDLLKTQVGKDRIGRIMDYSGVIVRGIGLNDIAVIRFYHGDPSDIEFRRNPSGNRSDIRSARPQYQAHFRTNHQTFVEFPNFRRGRFRVDYDSWYCVCGPPIFMEKMIDK